MIKNCLVIGDLNVDIVLNELEDFPELGKEIIAGNHFLDIGGSGGIFSAVLSGLGINTYIISKIGNDLFGKFLMSVEFPSGVGNKKKFSEIKKLIRKVGQKISIGFYTCI